MKGKEASLPSRRWRVRLSLLVVGLMVNALACLCWGPFQHAKKLITPTNTIGFQELWSLEVGGHERGTLLAADVDGDGAEELLMSTEEANQLLVIEEGQVTGEVHLQVPGRALMGSPGFGKYNSIPGSALLHCTLGRAQVVEGTHLAKILSTGVNLSLVDLSTGEVVERLGHVDGEKLGEGYVTFGDVAGDEADEFIVARNLGTPLWGTPGWPNRRYETIVFDAEGQELWRRETLAPAVLYSGDLDGDGRKEAVTPLWTTVDGQGNEARIGRRKRNTWIFWAGDVDGDGDVELVAGLDFESIAEPVGVYDVSGKRVWSYELEEMRYGAVGDVDGDGKKEIAAFDRHFRTSGVSARAAADADHWIFLFDANGELLWNWVAELSVDVYPGGFADVNGDGRDELAFFQYGPPPKTLYVYGIAP